MSSILDGPTATEPPKSDTKPDRQAVLTLSQLIAFNCRKTAKDSSLHWHNNHLDLKSHAEWKKELIGTLYDLGLRIS